MHELYAFVNIFVEAPLMDEVVQALSQIDAVEELYEVTGEYDLVMLAIAYAPVAWMLLHTKKKT